MPADSHITDPTLLAVLASATSAREQCLQLLDTLPSQEDEASLLAAKALNARLAVLRGLNRKAILAVRNTKAETTTSRQEIDSLLLGLQNLYYEQGHLLGEIRGCEKFDHVYTRLPMIPTSEFLAKSGLEVDEHELTLARIRDEHEARKELEGKRLDLVKVKEGLVRETQGKKEELGKLDGEIERWVKGLEGIGKVFEGREKKAVEAGT